MEAELLWSLWQISIDGKSFLEMSYCRILHKISERSPVLQQIFVQHTTTSEYSPCERASAAKSKRKLPAHHMHQQADVNFHHGKSYSFQLWSSILHKICRIPGKNGLQPSWFLSLQNWFFDFFFCSFWTYLLSTWINLHGKNDNHFATF
jgi:hypothetical protein